MGPTRRLLPPSSSLPTLRSLDSISEARIAATVDGLYTLFCPLPPSLAFQPHLTVKEAPLVDSGYTSGIEEEEDEDSSDVDGVAAIRDDAYERAFAERWLTGFIGRAEELTCFETDDARQRAIDKASCVLASFFTSTTQEDDEDIEITRDFDFALAMDSSGTSDVPIKVQLKDGLAGRDDADHTDVGLQSWGAAIIFSEMMCASPARFGLVREKLGSSPRIIELGAGTGLVSLVLAKMLPHLGVTDPTLIATDYHPSVLANLSANIASNFPSQETMPVKASLLDWSAPDLSPPLDAPAEVLVATDVIYESKHAIWLRDCAAQLLLPDGVFWLVATVRRTGRFEGISDTVRAAFTGRDGIPDKDGRRLTILDEQRLDKKTGIGRGDESEYKLFRIGWA
ncbi:putative methyltransferase-domain-containing protein [Xylariomycetidae sp. FL0641]|nr:putative methyltransferase-domain-containing protein [Xylariomycetidae sp. FL0641]